jgi:hypothetical protein
MNAFFISKKYDRKSIYMSINLENRTAVQNEKYLGILGHLMWSSIWKQLIETDELKERLIQSGLEVAKRLKPEKQPLIQVF